MVACAYNPNTRDRKKAGGQQVSGHSGLQRKFETSPDYSEILSLNKYMIYIAAGAPVPVPRQHLWLHTDP